MYASEISEDGDDIVIRIKGGKKQNIDVQQWKYFKIGDLFDIIKGKRLTKAQMKDGATNFIGSSSFNNGITAHIGNKENIHNGNLITVAYNGSVGETFYQESEFIASDDVNVLYPKFEMNSYIAKFFCPIIKTVGKSFAFIDKWKKEDMEATYISLPTTSTGEPDYDYMEKYMRKVEEKAALAAKTLKNPY